MSVKGLKWVKTIKHFTRRHWKALVAKLGGVEVVKAILRGEIRLVPVNVARMMASQNRGANYLTYLNSLMIGPTSGKVTVANAVNVFTGHIDVGFRQHGTNGMLYGSKDTPVQAVHVYYIRRSGMFIQLFRSLGDPFGLTLTQGQIVKFCRKHRNQFRSECGSTFFIFSERNDLYVAEVVAIGNRLSIYRHKFSSDVFSSGEGRVIVGW